ncbi:MAG: diguanylate cyclase [Clostridium sp.]|nr:diguanylate cyclase [Clostridium sp.]
MDTFIFLSSEFISILILFILLLVSKKDLNLGLNNTINRLHIFFIYLIIVSTTLKSFCFIISFFSFSFLINLNKLISMSLLAIYPFVGYIYAIYISKWQNLRYNKYILLSPCILNLILCILNLKFNILFKVNIYNSYSRETYFALPYLIFIFFYIYVLFSTIRRAKYMPMIISIVFIVLISLIIVINSIEMFHLNSPFLSVFISLLVTSNYFLIHRKLPYYETNLSCNNKKALFKDLFYYYNNKIEFTMLYFNIKKINSISKLLGRSAANNCILDFAHVLLMTFRNIGIPFYLHEDKFIIIIKNNNYDVSKILKSLNDKLKYINKTTNTPYLINYNCKVNNFSNFTSLASYLYEVNCFLTNYNKVKK